MSKKRCLFLVEGATDRQRFSVLQGLFDKSDLVIIPFQTDVLTKKTYSNRYKAHIRETLNKEKIYSFEDFDEIIQIVDTDGCFLSDSLIKVDHSVSTIKYMVDSIICPDVGPLIQQRENKRKNISTILSKGEIKLYYVSTNAEHAFDNIQNASDKEKRSLALKMYRNYSNNLGALIEKLKSIAPDINTFEDSWSFIMKGNNSLLAYSNIIFWLMDNLEYMKEESKDLVLQQNTIAKNAF